MGSFELDSLTVRPLKILDLPEYVTTRRRLLYTIRTEHKLDSWGRTMYSGTSLISRFAFHVRASL